MEVDDVEPSRKLQRFSGENDDGENLAGMSNNNRIRDWNPSSRIIRVSRASGGKDRHSKVLTSKGLRDRRIRLSVSTAIQFYDLQDRLGLDQPSKAVEWLLNAASDSISDLPSINPNFSNNGGIRDFNNNNNGGFRDLDTNLDNNFDNNQNQTLSLSKSGGSSASETSKNSSAAAGLSLSRTEIRGKARERARERTAKEREKDHNLEAQQSSFTQLLTGGLTGSGSTGHQTGSTRQWNGTDYFNQVQFIPSLPHFPPFTISSDQNRQEQQQMNHQFSFVPDATDYNTLNFGISSSTSCSSSPGGRSAIGGYNRGTLQSNSQSFLLNNNNIHQRSSSSSSSSSPMDSQSISFFMAAPPPPPPVLDHHSHNLQAGFDGRLFLYGNRSSDNKDKERR